MKKMNPSVGHASSEHQDERFRSELHPLTSITLLLTEQCNLRCDYCYIDKAARRMTPSIARQSVDFLFSKAGKQADKLAICFFGGEPLLEPELLRSTAEYALEKAQHSEYGLTFSITSNATLLDQKRYEMLREFRVKPTFSLDGIGASHDTHRKTIQGNGSFCLIENNLERMLSLPGATIRLTVAPDTAHLLYPSVCWLVEKGFKRISISAVYEALWDVESLSAYYDAWNQIYEYQQQLLAVDPHAYRIVNIVKSQQKLGNTGKFEWGCGAARNMVTIDANGYMYPCHRFAGYFKRAQKQQIGHVATGFYDQRRSYYIASNNIAMHKGCGSGLFQENQPADITCSCCSLSPNCGSNCMAVNEIMTGDPRTPAALNRVLAQIHTSNHLQSYFPEGMDDVSETDLLMHQEQ